MLSLQLEAASNFGTSNSKPASTTLGSAQRASTDAAMALPINQGMTIMSSASNSGHQVCLPVGSVAWEGCVTAALSATAGNMPIPKHCASACHAAC